MLVLVSEVHELARSFLKLRLRDEVLLFLPLKLLFDHSFVSVEGGLLRRYLSIQHIHPLHFLFDCLEALLRGLEFILFIHIKCVQDLLPLLFLITQISL